MSEQQPQSACLYLIRGRRDVWASLGDGPRFKCLAWPRPRYSAHGDTHWPAAPMCPVGEAAHFWAWAARLYPSLHRVGRVMELNKHWSQTDWGPNPRSAPYWLGHFGQFTCLSSLTLHCPILKMGLGPPTS